MASKSGHFQHVLDVVGFESFAQVEMLDNLLHEALGRLPKSTGPLLAQLGEACSPHGVALGRHDFHALAHPIALQGRQNHRQHGNEGSSCGQNHGQKLWLHNLFDQVDHHLILS